MSRFHPDAETSVVVIASSAPRITRTSLGGNYRNQLCVVHSEYSEAEVRRVESFAKSLITPRSSDLGVDGVGMSVTATGQPLVRVDAIVDKPGLDAALADQPARILEVTPWLGPPSSAAATS
jgi:hypothetical protein